MRILRLLAAGSAATIAASLLVGSTAASLEASTATERARVPIAAYSLVVPTSVTSSGLLARVVLPAGVGCPKLDVTVATSKGTKEVSRPMQRRTAGPTTLQAFDTLLVCEALVPDKATAASIAGRAIPAAIPRDIDSIALLGDSGCRLKGSTVQECNDPNAWPLARNALSIVRERPDVALFLGDFFYREVACPPNMNQACGGSPAPLNSVPFTDSAWAWVADVLVPMSPLLPAVPLLVQRGNHELCGRGGNGFFLMFDPALGSSRKCAASTDGLPPEVYSPTTSVDLSIAGGRSLRLVSVDSANSNDDAIDDSIAAKQRPLYVQARQLAKGSDDAWLLTHRPILGIESTTLLPDPPGEETTWSSVTQAYASYGLLDRFDLAVSSHIHLAQVVNVPTMPGQIVLGNAGTMLESETGYEIPAYGPLSNASGQPLAPGIGPIPTASSMKTWVRFGYAMATPTSSGWRFDMKDPTGVAFATCRTAAERQVACR